MKKWLALGLVVGLMPTVVMAASHPMAGCGLGYLLLSNKDNTKVVQILGATTNGTFGTQTFGISSGTSGCTTDGAVKLVKQAEVYAEINLDTLRHEMAAGQGEFVNTFVSLIGTSNRSEMVRFFQSEYASLFPTAGTTASEMLSTLSGKLAQYPELLG